MSGKLATRSYAGAGLLTALVAAVVLAACGSSDSGTSTSTSADTSPIKIGAVSAITGPIPIPDGTNGAGAYFDALNKAGGINGRQVDYMPLDDKSDPALSAQLVRRLVEQENVVALAGGESLVGCPVFGGYLKKSGIYDVMGGAATPQCFTSSNISPTNVGLQDDVTAGLIYASETLKKQKVCAAMYNLGPLNASYPPALAVWEKSTGKKLAYYTTSLTANTDLNGIMLKVKDAGCDALISNGSTQAAAPLLKAAAAQGATGLTQIFMGQEYTAGLPASVGKLGEGVYSTAEFEPFTGDTANLTQMKADLKAAGVELTALGQSGWLAAKIISDTIKGIKGEVTKESVGAALLKLTSYDTNGITAKPYSFGPGNAHHPNRSVKMVQIKNGKWVTASDWIHVDEYDK